jgi:hypothetical protein
MLVMTKTGFKGYIINLLIISAILLIVAGWILRIFYAHTWIEWENNFWISKGIDPIYPRFFIGLTAIIFFIARIIRKKNF